MVCEKELLTDLRTLVVQHRKNGKSLGEIAKKSRSTVQTIISNYELRGNTETAKRSGRPRNRSDTEVRKIVREV